MKCLSHAVGFGASPAWLRRTGALLLLVTALGATLVSAATPSLAADTPTRTMLTVVKRVEPPRDRGRFDLLIDGRVRAKAVGNGGTTGAIDVKPGRHTVSETAAPGTSLAGYTTTFKGACNKQGEVTLKRGEAKTCIIINKPKPTGRTTLRVDKVVVPSDARGLFNLTIDGVVRATNAGNGGTTGLVVVAPGPHLVGETAGAGTSLGDYVASYSGSCNANGEVTLSAGQAAVCTITNTRMRWTTKAPMPTPRHYLGVGVIGTHVYVVGGVNGGVLHYTTLERYTPATDTWVTKAPMPTARDGLGVAVVNGILYAVGGHAVGSSGSGVTGRVEAYDPATDTWTTKAPMPTVREGLGVGVVNGILYAVGGEVSGGSHPLATLQAYDPATDTWTTKAPMPTARAYLGVVGHEGKLYAVGGYGPYLYSGNLTLVQVYDPATDSWTTAAPITSPRRGIAVTTAHGFVYAIGGNNGGAVFGLAQRYDADANTWTTIAPMPSPRTFPGAATVGNRVYVIGGSNAYSTVYATNEAYEP